ncbi:hypothetical protein Vretifemale_5772 [Volvox reticuliferus]|nr:hypothetical protein Vretifemale_5772 [Volvox reticuliferus]
MGHDREAKLLAAECELGLRAAVSSALADTHQTPARAMTSPRSIAHTRSLAMLAIAAHTDASTAGVAAVDALATALGQDPAAAARADPSLADAAHGLGLLRALQGRWDAAAAPLSAAAEAAAATAAAEADEAGVPALPTAWIRQQYHREIAADALTGQAQLLMRTREWGEAEELMGGALKAMEAAYGERSPALAPLLTLLGYTYSRSARVTFAEGLYREAAKLLRLDPARVHQQRHQQERQQQQQPEEHLYPHPHPQQTNERQQAQQSRSPLLQVAADAGVHASSVAVLAWRYAQLLWVLPNRGGEASVWERCAREFWAASRGLGEREIETVLGGEGHLKGEGPEGSGVLFSTRFRRAWPCLSAT